MKKALKTHVYVSIILIFLLFLVNCSKKDQTALSQSCKTVPHIGTWSDINDISKKIIIYDDCTTYNTHCAQSAKFTLPDKDNVTLLSILDTNSANGCFPPETYKCNIVSGPGLVTGEMFLNQLVISCDNDTLQTYERIIQ